MIAVAREGFAPVRGLGSNNPAYSLSKRVVCDIEGPQDQPDFQNLSTGLASVERRVQNFFISKMNSGYPTVCGGTRSRVTVSGAFIQKLGFSPYNFALYATISDAHERAPVNFADDSRSPRTSH